jgi:hypothetical protein
MGHVRNQACRLIERGRVPARRERIRIKDVFLLLRNEALELAQETERSRAVLWWYRLRSGYVLGRHWEREDLVGEEIENRVWDKWVG